MTVKHGLDSYYRSIIEGIGEDTTRAGLKKTPSRAADAISFLTSGYNQDLKIIVNEALFPVESSTMVCVKSIEFFSLCEHHMLPFWGKAHVAYIPDKLVIGLSKIPRIVNMFARRLQIQENLTSQIAQAIVDATGAVGSAVIIDAYHMCMMMRGVEKQYSTTTTSSVLGVFKDDERTRNEFFQHVYREK